MDSNTKFNPNMPIYIPRVFSQHADEKYIKESFHRLQIGEVDRVDLIEKVNGGNRYFEAFVHFNRWYHNQYTYALQQLVVDPNTKAQVVFGQRQVSPGVVRPTFWIINECLNPETLREQELKSKLQDEMVMADWEVDELTSYSKQRDGLINDLFEIIELREEIERAARLYGIKLSSQTDSDDE